MQQWKPWPLLEYIAATLGAEVIARVYGCNSENRGHYWLITMTSDHIATLTLDTIVFFVIPFEKE
jgi:hypothetical protein